MTPKPDGDGLLDVAEVETDPLKADTDDDGLSDSVELAINTDPTDPDYEECDGRVRAIYAGHDPSPGLCGPRRVYSV